MKIFLDTNILLEYFCERTHADAVEKILSFIPSNGHKGYISVGSFYTLTYILETKLKKDNLHNPWRLDLLRKILIRVLAEYIVIAQTDLLVAVEDEQFTDLEDSYQYHTALSVGCEVFLTINNRDFNVGAKTSMEILTPDQFILKYF